MVQVEQESEAGYSSGMLAIDTSTEHAGLALSTRQGVITRSWPAGRTQTTSVLSAIDDMVCDAGLRPGELTAISIATGPGTFTGLRVGLSIAKGMVLALGVPVVGIPTLEIVAGGTDEDELIAVLPAGRGRVVWQHFGPESEQSTPRNTTLDDLVTELATMPDVMVTGELSDAQQDQVSEAHPLVHWAHRDPAVLLRLGAERLARGEADDPVTLEPLYVHGVVVQSGPVQDRLKRRT